MSIVDWIRFRIAMERMDNVLLFPIERAINIPTSKGPGKVLYLN